MHTMRENDCAAGCSWSSTHAKLVGAALEGDLVGLGGWSQLQPTRSRTRMSHYVLQCVLVVCLGRGNSPKRASAYRVVVYDAWMLVVLRRPPTTRGGRCSHAWGLVLA